MAPRTHRTREDDPVEQTPSHPLGSPLRRSTSRRTLLRAGLVLPPTVLVGVLAAKSARGGGTLVRPAAAQMPSCIVTPQLTEGPYFVDERLFRSDIRDDPSTGAVKDGVPLHLAFQVSQVAGTACTPLSGAVVDVWHCDALGVYSDVRDPGGDTLGQQFLRGSQYTDDTGAAAFQSIYPGWYMGRTVHIHFKVRTDPDAESGLEFTSQLFFDDALSDQVFSQQPYAAKGDRDTRNSNDGIFGQGDEQLLLDIVEEDDGYAAMITIGIDPSQTGPDAAQPYPPPMGGGPPPMQGGPPPGAMPAPIAAPPAQRPR
jgi:protocatechuate 3,4-dioxygenase beta subunit